ncbi:MAG: PAS domain-containing protein [Phascolarctobacterium sp.]|nr:PAS domain-containing protein [Phascolarctobacterium sp.]
MAGSSASRCSHDYDDALFNSMAHFSCAVWDIDTANSKVKILHDVIVPRLIGTVWTFGQAKSYMTKFAYPEDLDIIMGVFNKPFLESIKKTYIAEARAYFGDNVPHILRCCLVPHYDDAGSLNGLYATFAEIEKRVERKKGSKIADVITERDDSKAELKRYLSAVDCGIIQYKKNTKELIFINDIALKILGYKSKEEMQREHFTGVANTVYASDTRKIQQLVDSLKDENDSVEFEYHVRHRNGQELVCLGKARLLHDDDGEIIVQRSVIDITESSKTRNTYVQTMDNLSGARIGLWSLIVNGAESEGAGDIVLHDLIGVDENIDGKTMYKTWFKNVNQASKKEVLATIQKIIDGEAGEIIYLYHHPVRGDIIIRAGGILDRTYQGEGYLIRGYKQDITEFNGEQFKTSQLAKGFAAIFANVYEIDLKDETFIQLDQESCTENSLGKYGKLSELVAAASDLAKDGPEKEKYLEFIDFSTLNERLQDKRFLSFEYPLKTMGWTRQYIIPVFRDQNEIVVKVLVVVQSIQKEKSLELTRRQMERIQAAQAQENLDIVNDIVKGSFWYINFDENNNITKVFWSQKYRAMLGYKNEDEYPNTIKSWIDAIHPDDKEKVLNKFWHTVESKELTEPKFRMLKKDGTYDLFQAHARIATHPNGAIRLIAGFLTNITQQENEAKDINSRLEVFLGGVKGGIKICKYEENFPYVYVSKNLCAIQGYTLEEYLKVFKGYAANNVHPDDLHTGVKRIMVQFRDKQSYEAKYRIQHKDGHWFWVYEYGKLVEDAMGNKLVYSVVQDIDEQENSIIRLAAEKAKYAEALTNNSIYNFSLDLDRGVIESAIRTSKGTDLLQKVGLRAPVNFDEANKRVFETYRARILTPNGERIFSRAGLVKSFLEGKSAETVEYYLPGEDMYIRAMALISEDPITEHLIANVFALDVTEEKKNETAQAIALQDALTAAEHANKSKTTFLNSMSHDIRTPMNAIIGFTNLAATHLEDTEKVKDYLNKIQISSDHLLSLINDVLDMSRIESGKVKIEEKPTCLSNIIGSIQNIVQTDAKKRNLKVTFDASEIINEEIFCDKLRLSQVLLNCIGNSIKYTESGGKIFLRVAQIPCEQEGYATFRFVVRDTGIGMSQEFVNHLFEPFSREETVTVSGIQGTGLGMAITKNIIDMMGGEINVLSQKGFGTEITIIFTFKIASESDFDSDGLQKLEATAESLKDLRILLVEDNELNREIADVLLSEMGAKVKCVEDGSIAVQLLAKEEKRNYDIILMDVQMPIMDGYEATKNIRKLPNPEINSIPIIAMTANAFEEDRKLAIEAGMNEHVAKPISIARVLEAIGKVLN